MSSEQLVNLYLQLMISWDELTAKELCVSMLEDVSVRCIEKEAESCRSTLQAKRLCNSNNSPIALNSDERPTGTDRLSPFPAHRESGLHGPRRLLDRRRRLGGFRRHAMDGSNGLSTNVRG